VGYIGLSFYWAIYSRIQVFGGFGHIGPEVAASAIQSIFGFFIAWAYFSGMESSPLRATVGKLAVGLYVTNKSGGRITYGQATGRFFGKYLSGLLLGIGFFNGRLGRAKAGIA
jgi:uncharacterized RDD family membrane protein YckC